MRIRGPFHESKSPLNIMVQSDGDPEEPDEGDLVREDLPAYPRTHFDDLILDVVK